MVELSQNELKTAVSEGKDFILNYKTAYEIVFSKGANQYTQRKALYIHDGLPFTKRGRFFFADRETTESLFYGD